MKKEFEAYYSKHYAWIFFSLAVIFIIATALLWMFWIDGVSLTFVIICPIVAAIMLFVFAATIKKDGVAVEIAENKLILHKKEFVEIPLIDILKISIRDGDGSFDISIKTLATKYSMHCFIKEQRQKKDQLMALLKSKGIKVVTFDLSGVD